jgi:hypothetical protein
MHGSIIGKQRFARNGINTKLQPERRRWVYGALRILYLRGISEGVNPAPAKKPRRYQRVFTSYFKCGLESYSPFTEKGF